MAPEVLGAIAAIGAFELWTERDDDLQEQFVLLTSGMRILAAAALGASTTGGAAGPYASFVAGAFAAGAAVAASSLRSFAHGAVRQLRTEAFDPRRWMVRLEEGGVAGLVVAVYVGPFAAAAVLVLLALSGVAVSAAARRIERRWRRPCPQCGHLIRVEAELCTRCRAHTPPARVLDLRFAGALRDVARSAEVAVSAVAADVTGRFTAPDRRR